MASRRSVCSVDQRGVLGDTVSLGSFRAGMLPEINSGLYRVGHSLLVYKHDLYLYGGYGPKNSYSTFIFCNVKMTLQWKEIRGIGVVPGGRANHSAILHENKMIIYGGHRNLDVFDDLYSINLDTMRWERINYERAQGPGPVFSHAAVYVPPTRTMIIIGGFHQRQHNPYIAHSFDIRHRVWNGIRGPVSVNPSHIQLCCAAYNSLTTSLIVIGLMEKDVLQNNEYDTPSVFMMNVHTGAWVKIRTTASPENPILSRAIGVWEYFIREFITMGGIYDDERQEWYFPLLLEPLETFSSFRKMDKFSTLSTCAKSRQDSKIPLYGFLKLDIRGMSWSIASMQFPKRIIAEVKSRVMSKQSVSGERQENVGRRRDKNSSDKKKNPLLFSVSGVSRYQHKYAYAFIEISAARKQRIRKKVIVMHGGFGVEDYAAFVFTPILSKRRSSSVVSVDSIHAPSETGTTSLSSSRIGSKTERPNNWWDNNEDDSASNDDSDFSRLMLESKQEANMKAGNNTLADINIMVGRPHRLNSDPSVLPLMPSTRTQKNVHRFAVLYHPHSAVHSDKVLPDMNCPVAVINNNSETKLWAENLYVETRQWIATTLAAEREEEKTTRRNNRKQGVFKTRADDNNDLSLSDSSNLSKILLDTKSAVGSVSNTTVPITKPKDFFLEKNLEVFDLKCTKIQRLNNDNKMPFLLPGEEIESIARLGMIVKRNKEVQRLPLTVFQRTSLGNVTDLGGAAAYKLMAASLLKVDDNSRESQRKRAIIRWRYLRVMVLNGEASFIMHRVREAEGKRQAINFSSTGQLVLAPDLKIKVQDQTRVPNKPVPYTVPVAPRHVVHSSEITPSGYVMYHPFNHVKRGIYGEY